MKTDRERTHRPAMCVFARLALGVLALVLAAGLVGCARPSWCYGHKDPDRSRFDQVEVGMARSQVLGLLGSPTDVSKNAMHWQLGRYCDAWVFFSEGGSRVTGKYWQDGESLRLDEIPPQGD